jgi:Domain of unknown function (DUF5134)
MTPAWILDLAAAVMLVVAAVSAGRLVAARPWQHGAVVIDTDVAHLLMAIAMAGMLSSSLSTLSDTAWEVIFGLLTAWFAVRVALDAGANGVRALAGGHCAPHLVHSGAMLYTFLALRAPSGGSAGMAGMAGMAGGSGSAMALRVPTLAFLFVLILAGYSIWDLDQLSSRRYTRGAARVPAAAISAIGIPAMAGAEPESAGPRASLATAATPGPTTAEPAGSAARDGGTAGLLLSPAVTVGCRITMGVTMVFLLIISI